MVEVGSGVVSGRFPRRALRIPFKWYDDIHLEELLADWALAVNGEPLNPIAPLE